MRLPDLVALHAPDPDSSCNPCHRLTSGHLRSWASEPDYCHSYQGPNRPQLLIVRSVSAVAPDDLGMHEINEATSSVFSPGQTMRSPLNRDFDSRGWQANEYSPELGAWCRAAIAMRARKGCCSLEAPRPACPCGRAR